ncbi:MAG TPA: hypothetical protein VG897_13855, partial [Terriglobales bacterium]|nr:hypothetical protein [Terriglobales bacterium]
MPSSNAAPEPSLSQTQEWSHYIEDFRRAAHDAVDWIAQYLANTRDYPVVPDVRPGALVDMLPKSGPERGESFEAILRDFREQVIPSVTHWNHPGFLAYFA